MIFSSLALCLALLSSDRVADFQRIGDPTEAWAPAIIVAKWSSFDNLQPLVRGSLKVHASLPFPPSRGRVDLLRREGRRWLWVATGLYESDLTIPAAGAETGLLVRFEGTEHYFWGETSASPTGSISLGLFKNLSFTGTTDNSELSLFVASETVPRRNPQGQTTFRRIPLETALACRTSALGCACVHVNAATTTVTIEIVRGDAARVFRAATEAEDFEGLTSGPSPIRPKKVRLTTGRAFRWVSLTPTDDTTQWNKILIDGSDRDLAVQRIEGDSLLPPPSFVEVPVQRERGVIIRPWIGSPRRPLIDTSAVMLLFPHTTNEISAQIPLASIVQDRTGDFLAPSVGSGDYDLRLFSSVALADRMATSLTAGVPIDVDFQSGPVVIGRVVRGSGGTPNDSASIEVSPLANLAELLKGNAMERFRTANAADDGSFQVVLGLPGKYRLRARWGSASAERDFELDSNTKTLELGEILVVGGHTLRGAVTECSLGEATLIPVPDLRKPVTLGLSDSRHVAIDASGHFLVEGLTPGQWNASFTCKGTWWPSTPEVFSIDDAGDAIIDFKLTPQH